MFDLDKEIHRYLKKLQNKKLVSRSCLDELECHLRDEIEDRIENGANPETAYREATKSLGEPTELLAEFYALYGDEKFQQLKNVLSFYFDGRVMMRVFIGTVTGLFFIVGGLLLEGGHVSSMAQLTALLIVIGGSAGALMISYPLKTVLKSVILALTGRRAMRAAYLDAAKVFKTFGDMAILTGLVGFIFGAIHVLENLSEENMHLTGPGFAVALICVLYGVLARLFVGKALYDSFMFKVYPSEFELKEPSDPDNNQKLTA